MKPDSSKETTPSTRSNSSGDAAPQLLARTTRLPSQFTPKTMLLSMLVVYGLWLMGLAYVAWVNVQAGNQ